MYDIVYIGGGLNYAGAIVAAKSGKRVALVQDDLKELGGACLHRGCIPTKMFLHYASLVYQSHDEILKGELLLDQKRLFERKEDILQKVTKIIHKQCSGFELIEAKGVVVAPHRVQAGANVLEAKNIVIGTGSSAFIPEGIEYDAKSIITSDEVLQMQELPKSIAIYGSGAIGLEMASFFAAAGVKTVLLTRSKELLKQAHPLVSSALKEQLEKMGVTIRFEHEILSAKSTKRGVHVRYRESGENYFDVLLVAVGRRPNTDVIGCTEIELDNGAIMTDSHFQTTLLGHYAVGDCNAKLQLAHAARAQTLHVTQLLTGHKPQPLDLNSVVKFIHTLPMSYASVGMTKRALAAKNREFKEGVTMLKEFTYSLYNHATHGMMITYADSEGFLLGAEILAPNAEELIASVAMALAGEMDVAHARKTVLAHPTFSEALERSFFRI